ncbi:MAG: methyl-accepting chemotaxis protein [Candidatus Accumulibacter propinquus]|jgi:methyl-accepting chemotaxis protein|uniref:methyl-accepting chemotaxis protein n=1 Tax=Candidatus Accumulibacter propinquus TaxID=2954380 RepID=UPI002FC33B55
MPSLSIRKTLVVAGTLLLILFSVAMGVALNSISGAHQAFSHYVNQEQALLTAYSEMSAQGLQMGQAIRNIILDPANRKAYDNLEQANRDFHAALESASQLSRGSASTTDLLKIETLVRARDQRLKAIVELAATDSKSARTLLNKEETPIWRDLKQQILDQKKRVGEGTQAAAEQALAAMSRLRNIALFLAIGAVLIGATLFALALRRLTHRLGGDPEEATEIAQRAARGDFTIGIRTRHKNSLMAAMQTMIDKLGEIIGEVRTAADRISDVAEQVSATAQSLSQSSNNQASSVEETTSSMEQMGASIMQNTVNAKVTDNMASSAARQAVEGGLGEMVPSIRKTSDLVQERPSMQSIADKIGIIDDIAYQTNLLALNAAICARRRARQGLRRRRRRVRKLAERSQVAAQEISSVARDSVKPARRNGTVDPQDFRPRSGNRRGLAGTVLRRRPDQHAMGQLNQATQQNASVSEELAATAEEMGGQAQQLQELMGFFRLADSAADSALPAGSR